MLNRILVPLDGSSNAESILAQLAHLLAPRESELILLRVAEPMPTVDFVELRERRLAEARAYLETVAERLAASGLKVCRIVVDGPPAEAVLSVAAGEKASLIAMTTHGRTGLPRWVFGSVTEKVLRSSRVPVLVVRSFMPSAETLPARLPPVPISVSRLIVPVSSSDLSLDVVPHAAALAKRLSARVLLVNVLEQHLAFGPPVPQMRRAADQLMEADVPYEPILRQGDAASEILEVCREQGAGLIAMTTHGRTGLPRLVLGSVTEKVLRHAPVPMFVVRPQ